MKYLLEPEVAGSLGDKTELDSSVHPPVVHTLDYRIEGWLGDDLLESFPVFVAAPELVAALTDEGVTGFRDRGPGVVSFDEQFAKVGDSWPRVQNFRWLDIVGVPTDDLSLQQGTLVASERAWRILQQFKLDNCDVAEGEFL